MKRILRYLWMDKVSMLFLLTTIFLFIMHIVKKWDVSLFLLLVILFVFRGIMWQGKYIDRIRILEDLFKNIE